jgi:hypothetical protein
MVETRIFGPFCGARAGKRERRGLEAIPGKLLNRHTTYHLLTRPFTYIAIRTSMLSVITRPLTLVDSLETPRPKLPPCSKPSNVQKEREETFKTRAVWDLAL